MLYLLLEEVEEYLPKLDQGYTYWKKVAEFDAGGYKEALSHVPTDKYGKFKLFELKAVMELEVKRQDLYTLTEKVSIGIFSK